MYDEWNSENADVDDAPTPYWTCKRIILLVIVFITLIAFLIYTFSPLVSEAINRLAPQLPPIDLPSQRV